METSSKAPSKVEKESLVISAFVKSMEEEIHLDPDMDVKALMSEKVIEKHG